MDTNVVLSVIGIVVSIGIGVGTFYLADKRSRAAQWRAAKETVLRELSKSLGEGNVPEPPVILATIRSVLREHNTTDLAVVTFEEITDDLIRQVTSDPFLDAERRKELQVKILEIRSARAKEFTEILPKDLPVETVGTSREALNPSFMANMFAGVVASLVAGIIITKLTFTTERLKALYLSFGFYRIVMAVVVIMLLLTIKSLHKKAKRQVPEERPHTK